MKISYQVRTIRDRPVFAFDNLERAREGLKSAEKRIGIQLRLVKITQIEEEVCE